MDAQLGAGTGTAAVPSLGRSTIGMGTSLGIIREPRKPRESTTNAHDWVWLGTYTFHIYRSYHLLSCLLHKWYVI